MEGEIQRSRARRRAIVVAAASMPWWASLTFAQAGKTVRIGFLGVATAAAWATRVDALRAGLREKGYVEGRNLTIEFRYAEGRYDRLPALAADLVGMNVDVIVTHSAPGALAAKRATAARSTPVVMTNVSDALGAGIVTSLAKPGGNVTGDTFFVPELAAKRIEILKDTLPSLRRVGVLVNPDNAATPRAMASMEAASAALAVALRVIHVRNVTDLDAALASLAADRVDGLAIVEDIVLIQNHVRIAKAAIALKLPSISFVEYAEEGGLIGYGADYLALYRGVAGFVDAIVKGTPAGTIPIHQARDFDLVINTETAKALGIAVPPGVVLRATRRVP